MNENVEGPQKALPFGVAFDVVPGMDGKAWPRIQIINGLTAFILTLPMAEFEKFVEGFAEQALQVMEQTRKQNNPIKVASNLDGIRPRDPRVNGLGR